MADSVIGALRIVLGLDSARFEEGLTKAQRDLRKAGKEFEKLGRQMNELGRTFTLGLTAPVIAFGVASIKVAGDFEASMIKVGISTKATTAEMSLLEAEARKIGKATVFSATEAADAMDMLAKTGLDATTILGGAAAATVNLAAAAGSKLEPAASAIADSMQQFKLSADDLPNVVNQITGAVNESKLSFEDFTQGIGQAGGVAAGLGVSFEDFNAVLAGTSALFSSGSDAGTSFKTFLTTLTPKTKEAAGLMAQYRLSFFEASGEMKSMGEIAEILRTQLGGLSDEAKTQVLKDIFGTDAMRTAIGLMDQGAAGLEKIKTAIQETDAAAQAAKRMEGFNGQLQQLKGAFEDLAIAIGKSGLLTFMTDLVRGLANVLEAAAGVDPILLGFGLTLAGVAASIGPIVIGLGTLTTSIGAILELAASAAIPVAAMGATIAALAGPLAIAAAAITAVVVATAAMSAEQAKVDLANKQVINTLNGAKPALDAYDKAVRAAALATGEARKKAIEHAEAMKREAAAAVLAAQAIREKALAAAEAAAKAAKDARAAADPRSFTGFIGAMAGAEGGMASPMANPMAEAAVQAAKREQRAQAELKAATEGTIAAKERLAKLTGDLNALQTAAGSSGRIAAAGTKESGDAAKKAAKEASGFDQELKSVIDSLKTDGQRAAEEMAGKVKTLDEAFARGKLTLAEYTDYLRRIYSAVEAVKPDLDVDGLKDVAAEGRKVWDDELERREEAYEQSVGRMADIGAGFFQSWIASGKADWKRLLLDIVRNWKDAMAVLAAQTSGLGATLGKVLGSIGSAVQGQAIGQSLGLGTGSSTANLGLAVGGSIAGGLLASSSLAGTIGAGIANGVLALGGSAAVAGTLGTLLTSAAVLGPIGAIAALAVGTLFKKKPSNNGALATLDGDSFTLAGDKRTDETSQMASSAAQAILAGQKLLQAAGIALTETVRSIDIGTRDATDIVLSSGRALTSGVGDAASAAETALKALLTGASFASEAQKALVDSMVSAGKGFDDIAAALAAFGEAQKLPQAIADAIQQLQDPTGFELTQLKRDQEERRKSIQTQVDAGYITAEQFAVLNDQLKILEDLELGKALGHVAGGLDAVASAQDRVVEAYERDRAAIEDRINQLRALGDSLRAFGKSLAMGPAALLSPKAQYDAAKAAFDDVSNRARNGDLDAAEQLEQVGGDFLEASRAFFASGPKYFADLQRVQAAVSATASLTDGLLSEAEAQLDLLERSVEGQIATRKAVETVNETLINLGKALTNYSAFSGQDLGGNQAVNAALAAATGYRGDFGAGGFQAWIVDQSEEIKAKARDVLNSHGQGFRISGFATGTDSAPGGWASIGERGREILNIPRGAQVIPNDVMRGLAQMQGVTLVDEQKKTNASLGRIETSLAADKVQRAAIANRDFAQGEQIRAEGAAAKRAARARSAR